MAIKRTLPKKAPTQNPLSFYNCDQQGGKYGIPTKVPDVLKSGKVREQIFGRKSLAKQ